ncbi:MAG: ribosome biogenesis GTP-binding protein YihA/YsxC [Fibrobacter sp.]|nr:ribosome biogenesis GTP-binding protein YihA/YsxC [Fibrobacter sp.]
MNQKVENSENNSITNNRHHNVSFMISAANYTDIKPSNDEEYAILGRSNVGKSSFINHVLENRNLARISKKPGKTSLANFYRVDQQMVWVDLPGYGYAKVSGGERIRWSKLIASYCEKRKNLCGIIWLIDIRHIGAKADIEAYEWLKSLDKSRQAYQTAGTCASQGTAKNFRIG